MFETGIFARISRTSFAGFFSCCKAGGATSATAAGWAVRAAASKWASRATSSDFGSSESATASRASAVAPPSFARARSCFIDSPSKPVGTAAAAAAAKAGPGGGPGGGAGARTGAGTGARGPRSRSAASRCRLAQTSSSSFCCGACRLHDALAIGAAAIDSSSAAWSACCDRTAATSAGLSAAAAGRAERIASLTDDSSTRPRSWSFSMVAKTLAIGLGGRAWRTHSDTKVVIAVAGGIESRGMRSECWSNWNAF